MCYFKSLYFFVNALRQLSSHCLSLFLFLVSGILLCLPQPVLASEHATKQWEIVSLDLKLSDRLLFNLDTTHRNNGGFGHSNTMLLRPSVGYKLTKHLSLWQGYGWTPKFYPYQNQQQLWEQMTYKRQIKKLTVSNRVRLEERFIPGVYHGAAVRLREKAKVLHPLSKDQRWYVVAYDEVFYNLNTKHHGPQGGFDQNRLFMGLGRQLNAHAAVETGYVMQYINHNHSSNEVNHVIQIGLKFKS